MNDRLRQVLRHAGAHEKGRLPLSRRRHRAHPAGGNPGAGAGGDGKLVAMDPSIPELMSTVRPEKLLKNDGTIVTQVVHSVAAPDPKMAKANRAFDTGTKIFTFKSFLSAQRHAFDQCARRIGRLLQQQFDHLRVQSIRVPIMVAAMGGYHFVRDQEVIYDKSASADKDYVVIEGALHGYTPCKECEKTPGQYSNTVKNLFDYIAAWTNKRF
jgi:hypothetical protein